MTSIVYLATTPITYERLMRGHLSFMREAGFEVTAVSAPGPQLGEAGEREQVRVESVAMEREISPVADVRSLVRLVALFRRLRPEVVNAGTPKAGMLGMIAAKLAGVPVRIYTLRGLRAETLDGPMGKVMALTEKLTSACATDVVCVSSSLRDCYVERGLAGREKTAVLGDGSSNGVDAARFEFSTETRSELRQAAGISEDAPVIGFVGRLVHDKGIAELVAAFDLVRETIPDAVLLLVGDHEEGDPVDDATKARIDSGDGIRVTGYLPDASRHYSAFDVLAFASRREGFPNAPLEAASAGVPTVGFDATGTRDAIVDGETGMLVPQGDVQALADGLRTYLSDVRLRLNHGLAARERAERDFNPRRVWHLLEAKYRSAAPGRSTRPLPVVPRIESEPVESNRTERGTHAEAGS